MAASDLTFDDIHSYLQQQGGRVQNAEFVRHFGHYLKDPLTKEEARKKFKAYVNELASLRTEDGHKWVILRPRYHNSSSSAARTGYQQLHSSPKYQAAHVIGLPTSPHNSIGIPVSPIPSQSGSGNHMYSPQRVPPPYRPPPPVPASPASNTSQYGDNVSLSSSMLSLNMDQSAQVVPQAPQAPPRRKSSDKLLAERREASENVVPMLEVGKAGVGVVDKENERPRSAGDAEKEVVVSVRERTQKFNRLASVDDESPKVQKPKKTPARAANAKGVDEDDGASVTSLESKKCVAWIVAAAKGEYQELAKLANKEPRLVKLKDPYTYSVLHWGAKHGNADIIKLFAGTYSADVNAKTNGGYTPLHLAAHFGKTDVYKLLIEVYKADDSIRDYRGKKAAQYLETSSQVRSKASGKTKSRKNKYGDKFLRVGSLNVRVKKTTEAFSSFLGVGSGGGSLSTIEPIAEKVHKGWGSADNVAQEGVMPAPKGYITKRRAKRPTDSRTHSNPGTPNQPQKIIQRNSQLDSDSDSAAGFDSTWQN